jgi:polar amino acid transport system ATP-binding protein
MTENKILSVRGISKSFDSLSVLKGVSFDVKQGDVIAILGPSGAGKTTLLRCINHLITPDDGDILFKGSTVKSDRKSIRFFRAKVGFVFQRLNLVSHLRVIDNVALTLVKVLCIKWREAREIALKQLSQVGLEDKAASFPSQLSGGQQQRVGIARALVMQPDIVLLDEPTSALDPSRVGEGLSVIKRLASEGRTMVIVTHEIDFARNIATRVLFMKGGSILKDTNPQEFFESASSEIRDFLTDLSSIV